MSSFVITRKIEIDAAHRVPSHESKCRNIHGHRYTVEATVEGTLYESGPQEGMVLDFGFLKELMVELIDGPADHAMIAWAQDPLLCEFKGCCGKLLVVPYVPTAENLARYWFEQLVAPIQTMTNSNGFLSHVRVYETPNCWSDYPV